MNKRGVSMLAGCVAAWCAAEAATVPADILGVKADGDATPVCAIAGAERTVKIGWQFRTDRTLPVYQVYAWSLGVVVQNTQGARSTITAASEHPDLLRTGPGGRRPDFTQINAYAPGNLTAPAATTQGAGQLAGQFAAVTQAVMFDYNQVAAIPSGTQDLGSMNVRVLYQGVDAGTTSLAFSDLIGDPPVSTAVVVGAPSFAEGERVTAAPGVKEGLTVGLLGPYEAGCLVGVGVSGDTSPVCVLGGATRTYDVAWEFPGSRALPSYEVHAWSLGLVLTNAGQAKSFIRNAVEHPDLAAAGPGGARPEFDQISYYAASNLQTPGGTTVNGTGIAGKWAAVTQAVILDVNSQAAHIPAPSAAVGALRLEVAAEGGGAGATSLNFSDAIGSPPVRTVAVIGSDAFFPPAGTRVTVPPATRRGLDIELLGEYAPGCIMSIGIDGDTSSACAGATDARRYDVAWTFPRSRELLSYEVASWSFGVVLENSGGAASSIVTAVEHPDLAAAGPGGGRPAFDAISFFAPGDLAYSVGTTNDGTGFVGSYGAVTQAVVLDFDQVATIPAPRESVGSLRLTVALGGTAAGETSLAFSDEIGVPPVSTIAIVGSEYFEPGERRGFAPGTRRGVAVRVAAPGEADCLVRAHIAGATEEACAGSERAFEVGWDFPTSDALPAYGVNAWSLGVILENGGGSTSYITTAAESADLAVAGPHGGRPSFDAIAFFAAGTLAEAAGSTGNGTGLTGEWVAVTQAVVLDFDQVVAIPAPAAGFGALAVVVAFRSAAAGTTALAFTNELGTPPVSTAVVLSSPSFPSGEQRVVAPAARDGIAVGVRAPGDPACAVAPTFKRGDANADRNVDIGDPIFVLSYLFARGRTPTCRDTADGNDDGSIDIGDPIKVLGHLFAQAGPLPPPFTACGEDPTTDAITCDAFAPCD